ncbi:MAG TPA: hypothetical protein VHF23_01565 [Gaiellaceae bacterium]|nr:hypothetical protein [Gaiellaceae bacterium]
MAAPAPRRARVDPPRPAQTPRAAPPTEAQSYQRALRQARARRRARLEHQRELKRARVRFLFLLVGLVLLTAFIALSIWEKIEALFGL